jgi:hypothetical protein
LVWNLRCLRHGGTVPEKGRECRVKMVPAHIREFGRLVDATIKLDKKVIAEYRLRLEPESRRHG